MRVLWLPDGLGGFLIVWVDFYVWLAFLISHWFASRLVSVLTGYPYLIGFFNWWLAVRLVICVWLASWLVVWLFAVARERFFNRVVNTNLFQLACVGAVSPPVGSGAEPRRQADFDNNLLKINWKSGLWVDGKLFLSLSRILSGRCFLCWRSTTLFVYGKYYFIKKIKTWPKFRVVTAPVLKFHPDPALPRAWLFDWLVAFYMSGWSSVSDWRPDLLSGFLCVLLSLRLAEWVSECLAGWQHEPFRPTSSRDFITDAWQWLLREAFPGNQNKWHFIDNGILLEHQQPEVVGDLL